MKKSTFFAGLLSTLLLVGCGQKEQVPETKPEPETPTEPEVKPETPEEVKVTGVTIEGEDELTKYQPTEGTVELKATVAPENATNKKVVWSSSDETIATVDTNGKVTLLKGGNVTITAKSEADDTKKAEVKIKSLIAPTGFTFEADHKAITDNKFVMTKGDQKKVYAKPTNGEFATYKGKWTSSDEKVVGFTSWGGFDAKKAGTATLTYTSDVDNTVKASLTVEVKEPVITVVAGTFDFDEVNTGYITKTTTLTNGNDKLVIEVPNEQALYLDKGSAGKDVKSFKFNSKSKDFIGATFTLPAGYTKVKVYATQWKAGEGSIKFNGVEKQLTHNKGEGKWDEFIVDYPADGKLKIEGNYRVLMDKFVFVK